MISAELIAATRPKGQEGYGLATFQVKVPVYVWTELLTHKRLARNASSSRAQSQKRHANMGWYTPPVFYEQGEFMQAGEPLPEEVQEAVRELWDGLHRTVYQGVSGIDTYVRSLGFKGLAKEQINRPLGTTKMLTGVVTATEDAWRSVLALRKHPAADTAMQLLAYQLDEGLRTATWWHADWHIPFDDNPAAPRDLLEYRERAKVAAARLARVSNGKPGPGQRSDLELAEQLLTDRHLSPFEHVARMEEMPPTSAVCSVERDLWFGDDYSIRGWANFRADIEAGVEL